jgi:DNA-binding MarR family transcriptional regulator
MKDYQFSVLVKLYLFGKKLQALAKKHNSDRFSQSIILRLASQKKHTVTEVADLLSIKVSAATSKVIDMEESGLLIRSLTKDKRSHVIAITKKGKKTLLALKNIMSEKPGGTWFCLTKPQACVLEKLVDRIRLE